MNFQGVTQFFANVDWLTTVKWLFGIWLLILTLYVSYRSVRDNPGSRLRRVPGQVINFSYVIFIIVLLLVAPVVTIMMYGWYGLYSPTIITISILMSPLWASQLLRAIGKAMDIEPDLKVDRRPHLLWIVICLGTATAIVLAEMLSGNHDFNQLLTLAVTGCITSIVATFAFLEFKQEVKEAESEENLKGGAIGE